MTEEEKQRIRELAEKLINMDESGRAAAKMVVEALLAKNAFKEEKRDERREEEGSPAERTDDSHEKL